MRRRDFLRACGTASVALATPAPLISRAAEGPRPLAVGPGPQLFLDDYLIDRLEGLTRRVEQPQRLGRPVLDSKTFGTTQPYLTALRDPQTKGFRLWYNRGPAVWHADSDDGIRWA